MKTHENYNTMEEIENMTESTEIEENTFEEWLKNVGEKPIKEIFELIGNIKLKYIVYALGGMLGLIGVCLGIRYVLFPVVTLIWEAFSHTFFMVIGSEVYQYEVYHFFDSDLWRTISLCLGISIVVANNTFYNVKFLTGLFYFVFLIVSIEYWNYLHIHNYIEAFLGATFFVIFFIVIPILLVVRNGIAIDKEQNTMRELSE